MVTIVFRGMVDASHFLGALRTFLRMYRYGFHFTDDTTIDENGTHWGFYRFNQDQHRSIFEVDFAIDQEGNGYFHVRGDDVHVESRCDERKVVSREHTKVDAYDLQY